MARADTLELLSSLIDKLEPIGKMSPGQPIRATEWNELVDAVRTVARVAVARERTTDEFLDERYARSDHKHLGQVTLEWFDPPARTLLEENMQGSVTQRAEVTRLRNETAQLRASIEEMAQQIKDVRISIDGLRDADASRGKEVGRVSTRVEALRDVETRVATLDTRFTGIATNVEAALAFRDELRDETGAPINVRLLNTRIVEFGRLRENLQTANGEVVQIREVERAIARLEENLVGRRDIEDVVVSRFRDRALLEQSGLIGAVREQVEGALSDRLGGLEQRDSGLSEEITGLRTSVEGHEGRLGRQDGRLSNAETQIGTLSAIPERVNQQGTRLADVETRVQAAQNGLAEVGALRGQLDQVRTEVTGLRGVSTTVTALEGRMTNVEAAAAGIGRLVTTTESTATRVTAIEAGLPALNRTATTVTQLSAAMAQFNTRLTATESELDNLDRLPGAIDGINAQLRGFADFQTTTTQRLNEMNTRVSGITTLTERVSAAERQAAENRNSLARFNSDLAGVVGRLDRLDSNTRPRPVEPVRPIG